MLPAHPSEIGFAFHRTGSAGHPGSMHTNVLRNYYIYGTDSGKISAIRFDDRWKATYMEQKSHGTRVWRDELVPLKAPLLLDLRMDPFEKALHTNTYCDFYSRNIFVFGRAALVAGPKGA